MHVLRLSFEMSSFVNQYRVNDQKAERRYNSMGARRRGKSRRSPPPPPRIFPRHMGSLFATFPLCGEIFHNVLLLMGAFFHHVGAFSLLFSPCGELFWAYPSPYKNFCGRPCIIVHSLPTRMWEFRFSFVFGLVPNFVP